VTGIKFDKKSEKKDQNVGPLTFFILFGLLYITYVRFDVFRHICIWLFFLSSLSLYIYISFSYVNKFSPFLDFSVAYFCY
jgi:hypothetical protein